MEIIARAAGGCRSTVSLALRNHPGIPFGTRQRIKAIASRLGYRPNPFVTNGSDPSGFRAGSNGIGRIRALERLALLYGANHEPGYAMRRQFDR
ncbi:MAG: helix-turn-helix domain-containing protein [Candidatus Omnitrophica bacterium]|nr:helix-turn-helix domain-containing protein [Candidatus Omnitrophota bacterium]